MKCSRSDNELFDSMSGRLDAKQSAEVEAHLAGCEECRLVASIVGQVRHESTDSGNAKGAPAADQTRDSHSSHLDIGELADFFYGSASGAANERATAHVAMCSECAELLSQHATGAAIALQYNPGEHEAAIPDAGWRLINEWEESSFGGVRPAEDRHDAGMVERMLRLFNEKRDEIREAVSSYTAGRDVVPVVVVDRQGSYRRVELFEQTASAGAVRLTHTERSSRFRSMPLHTIVRTDTGDHALVSTPIQHDSIEVGRDEHPGVSYDRFIIED